MKLFIASTVIINISAFC